MKKILVLAICALTLIAFTACDNGNTVEYADPELAKSLVDSINVKNVAADILAAANNPADGSNGLKITYAFADGGDIEGAVEAGDNVSIKVTATAEDYNNGIWNQEAIDGVTDRSVSGTVDVVVTGKFAQSDSDYTFTIASYTATATDVTIDDDGDGTADHTFAAVFSGTASGTITLSSGTFSVADIEITIPAAADVDATLDTKPVDYNRLCSETGFKPGDVISLSDYNE